MTQQIEWADGSDDKIYITANEFSGNQQIAVSSDPNTGAARSKVVTFSAGNVSKTLTVEQAAGAQEKTLTLYPSSYDTENYSWYSASNISNGYASAASSSYAQLTNAGSYAECYIFYKFDTSQIPNGATILSVECSVKALANGNSTTTPQKKIQLFTGTTAKGSASNMTSSLNTIALDAGDWTLAELRDIRVRAYTKAGSTTSRYYIRFYGATLTIKYRE